MTGFAHRYLVTSQIKETVFFYHFYQIQDCFFIIFIKITFSLMHYNGLQKSEIFLSVIDC